MQIVQNSSKYCVTLIRGHVRTLEVLETKSRGLQKCTSWGFLVVVFLVVVCLFVCIQSM